MMNLREATVKAENVVDTILSRVKSTHDLPDDWYGDNYHSMLQYVDACGFDGDLFDDLVSAIYCDMHIAYDRIKDSIAKCLEESAKQYLDEEGC